MTDRFVAHRALCVQLHWLLPDAPWRHDVLHAHASEVSCPGQPVQLVLASEGVARRALALTRAASPRHPLARPQDIAGWHAPTYGHKEPAVSVLLSLTLSPGEVILTSEFTACESR